METIKKPDELDLDELLIYTKVDDPLVYSPRTLEAYPHQTLETNHLLRPPCSAVHREHRRGGFRVLRRFHAHALTIGKTKCQSCISRCMDKQSPASVKQSSRIWCDTIRTCTQTFKRYSYQLSPIAPIETFAFVHRGAALSKKSGYKPSGTCNCYTKRG